MAQEYKTFEDILKLGKNKGLLKISDDILKYISIGKTYRITNPEEIIRASYYVELIIKYKYPKSRIDIEVVVPRREPKDKADIVVFEDYDKKNPYIVVECKKDGISQNEIKQAIEQVFGNANSLGAKYAILVAGNVRIAFDVANFPPMEREKNVIADIPIKYGKIVKFKYRKGEPDWDLRVVERNELLTRFQQCHDTLWDGGKRNPAEAFDEMSKLMFCKIHDERFLTTKGNYYSFQVGTNETISEVASRIVKIYNDAQNIDPDVFLDTIKAEEPIIYSVVEILQGISLSKTDLDSKGVAFEHFLGSVFRGEMGQYFTPRTIVEFMIQFLEPNIHDLVIDPACGSGGFLIYTLDKVKKDLESTLEQKDAWDRWKDFALKQVYGIEINSQLARVSMMNMIIHEDGHTNIENNDSLDNPQKFNQKRAIKKKKFTLLLTNPPFGAVKKEKENPYINDYILGGKNQKRKSQNTEILFIERCIELLKPGGRMGIVLPDSILTNSSLQYVRDFCIEKTKILGVVSLPLGSFTHYGTGVKASLVFLRKYREDEKSKDNYPIFMAVVNHIGYDTTGRIDKNEFPKILEFWNYFKENEKISSKNESPSCFSIMKRSLENALNPARYSIKIPKKVKWTTINTYGEIIHKILQPKKFPKKLFYVIRIDDLENNCYEASNFRSLYGKDLQGTYQKTQKNDILITRLGPGILNRKSLVCSLSANTTIASTEFIVFRPNKDINPWGILAILKTNFFVRLMYSKGRGATPSRFRLIREDFKNLPFPNLHPKKIDSIGREFWEHRNKANILKNKAQNLVEDIQKKVESITFKHKPKKS